MRLHTGIDLSEVELNEALKVVSSDLRKLAYGEYNEDCYASHVSREDKLVILMDNLNYADAVMMGKHNSNFTIWQRVDTLLTGECVGLLP